MEDQKPTSEEKDSEASDESVSTGENGPSKGESAILSGRDSVPPQAQQLPEAQSSAAHRRCALCNCGEWSLHGQRELQRYKPSADWPELTSRFLDRADSCPAVPQETLCGDELSRIGFVESVLPKELFESTGHCWVHHWCASWSVGVHHKEGAGLTDVDKAVFSGISQKCEYCKRMGATIQCHSKGCLRFYHFPCATASGSFQSMKTLNLLCTNHVEEATAMEDARCMLCDAPGDLRDLLFCTSCGLHYHGTCLEIVVTPLKRSGWQCPECKVCQTCRRPGEDSMMLVCDACDKGYHTFCLKPAIESLPTDSWKCKNCRICSGCGCRPAQLPPTYQWYQNYTMCEECQQQRNGTVDCTKPCTKPELAGGVPCSNTYQKITLTECDDVTNVPCPAPPVTEPVCMTCKDKQKEETEGLLKERESSKCEVKPLEMPMKESDPPEEVELKEEAQKEEAQIESLSPSTAQKEHDSDSTSCAKQGDVLPDAKGYLSSNDQVAPTEEVPNCPSPAKMLEDAAKPGDSSPSPQTLEMRLPPEELHAESALLRPEEAKEVQLIEPQGMNTEEQDCLTSLETPNHIVSVDSPSFSQNLSGAVHGLVPVSEASPLALTGQSEAGILAGRDSQQISVVNAKGTDKDILPSSGECKVPLSFFSEHKSSEVEESISMTPMEVFADYKLSRTESQSLCENPETPLRTQDLFIKSDIVNEISNLSQGDASGSFHGSDPMGTPDHDGGSLSMELCTTSKDDCSLRLCGDSLVETDDSLFFEPSGAKMEGEKSRRRSSPGRSRVKQGRSSSFPGRRRPRGGTGGGGAAHGRGRGRSRLKSTTSSIETLALADIDSSPSKEDDEEEDDTMQNTVVLFSNTDKFVLMQDMCVVCGSFGRGSEGHLLPCSQCAQCYHPYCVNSKITKVMLLKGWRCVECIVCEVCGKASDPSRLLLCDDCDISYHTYCLEPPLHTVPKGGWKCKWCVCCMQCGSVSPGFHAEWQNNYTHCAPCASLVTCPICRVKYVEEDLIIQCRHCERWLHAVCENLFTEEEVEQAADEGFDCTSCQPYVIKPVVPVVLPEIIPVKIKEPEPQYFRFEGVWLTEAGMSVLRSLSMSPLHKRRQRRSRPSTNGELGMEAMDPIGQEERKEGEQEGEEPKPEAPIGIEPMDCEIKMEPPGSPEREGGGEVEPGKGIEELEDGKKRKRKPYRPGIGGFMVRQRKSHTRTKRGLAALLEACRESMNMEAHPEEAAPADPVTEGTVEPSATEVDEKKKRRGRKKSKLEDMFPAYLQEAFFGRALIDLSRKALLAAGEKNACPPMGQAGQSTKAVPCASGTAQKGVVNGSETPGQQRGDDGSMVNALQGNEESKVLETNIEIPAATDSLEAKIANAANAVSIVEEKAAVLPPEGLLSSDLVKGAVPLGSLPSTISVETSQGVCQPQFVEGSRDRSGFFSPEHCEMDSPWTTPSTPTTPTEGEGEGLSYNQRSLQRWEKDEELGELSTISPVLYANMNFPNLKQDYPDWSTRCKQIMKLWRKVPATDKAPYLQKAKDNRAAHRISKVQKQAENQINKQSKGEGGRKAERPSLHLRIPPQMGPQSGPPQTPPMTELAASIPMGQSVFNTSSSLSTSSDRFMKRSSTGMAGAEIPSDSFKPPPQSPAQVPSNDPFGNAPTFPSESHFQSSLGQSPASSGFQTYSSTGPSLFPSSRSAIQAMEFHSTSPGTPRQPSTSDPFFKPRYSGGSLDNLEVPGSPGSRPSPLGDCGSKPVEPLMSPTHYGEQKKTMDSILMHIKKEDVGLQAKHDVGVMSPGFVQGVGFADSPSNPPLGMEMKCATSIFKAPLTPRVPQVEPHSPAPIQRSQEPHGSTQAASPQQHPEVYRQSPSLPFSDPYVPPTDSNCAPPRSLLSDPYSRVPASPQSQASSHSPVTPRPLSSEAVCQSPVTPRFQSPDSYSRPPSRPQSRDPFSPLHKPPRPQMAESVFRPVQIYNSPGSSVGFQQGLPPTQPGESHCKVPASPQQASYARSPGSGVFPGTQGQLCFTFPQSPAESAKGSPSHQPSLPQSHGMNSHFTPTQPMNKLQSSSYSSSSPRFQQAGSPGSENYSLSPLRPPSVLQQDGPYLGHNSGQRTGIPSPAEKREEVSGHSSPLAAPTREVSELQGTPETPLSSINQTELEKQRQRQRLRELLIRQQIQRNNLRQEKEAAAATASQASWSADATSPAFDLSTRGVQPYQVAQDKSSLGNMSLPPGSGKLAGPVMAPAAFSQDGRLSRPPPSATPSSVDIGVSSRQSIGGPQMFFPRGAFQGSQQQQQQHLWHMQQRSPTPSRFPQPLGVDMSRPASNSTVGLPSRMAVPSEQIPGSSTMGAPYIELRHNTQKGIPGATGIPLSQQNLQTRPRFFISNMENQSLQTVGIRTQVMPIQNTGLVNPLVQPQKIPALPSSPQNPEASNIQRIHAKDMACLTSGLEQPPQHAPRTFSTSNANPCPGGLKEGADSAASNSATGPSKIQPGMTGARLPCVDTVEPDLDVDFDSHKDLEDDDDLTNLSLDPDVAKGDDDLGNLDNLETNDPHLDDLLNGDEFDLLAYTDPELDTGDKKDIFNEHLRLVESANEKAEREALMKKEPSGPCVQSFQVLTEQGKESMQLGQGNKTKHRLEEMTLSSGSCPPVSNPNFEKSLKVPGITRETKVVVISADIKPKLEDDGLKLSTCQFSASNIERQPIIIKSEAAQNADKMSLSHGLKAGRSLLASGDSHLTNSRTTDALGSVRNGSAQLTNRGHPALSYSSSGGVLSQKLLMNQRNPALEKFDLGGSPLNLPSAHHSSGDDLDKMESSLVASELPLLIEDLLEHEKKELQKKQLMSVQHLQPVQQHSMMVHPSGLPHQMPQTQQQQQPPPHDGQSSNLVGPPQQLPLGIAARQQNLTTTPHLLPQQQRLAGSQTGHILAPHSTVAQSPGHNVGAQHTTQPVLPQQQGLLPKQIVGVQQQQQPLGMKPQPLVQQQQLANSFFPDTDLDKFAAEDIMDPIAKAKMVALKGIKKVMAQGSIGVPQGMNRQQVSLLAQRLTGAPGTSEAQNHTPAGGTQTYTNESQRENTVFDKNTANGNNCDLPPRLSSTRKPGRRPRQPPSMKFFEKSSTDSSQSRPNPPTFAQGVINETDQRQYEEWLFHTQQLLQMQLKVLEEQIGVHRKSRKALCAKQRTAKKAGREFPEADAEKLKLVTEQQSKIQKQLDQVRKQQKEHTNLMAEYRNKQQQHQQATAVMALSPSQSSRVIAKIPGQILQGHVMQQQSGTVGSQGNQLVGQAGNLHVSSSGITLPSQQSVSFMSSTLTQQQQHPGGSATVPGTSGNFFPGTTSLRGLPNNRLIQERQLQLQQQRMQLAQKLQQQSILSQASLQQQSIVGQTAPQSMPGQQQSSAPPQNNLGSPMAPKQQGLVGNPQGIVVQQQNLIGHSQVSVLQHQGVIGHQTPQRQVLMTQQQRVLASPQLVQQQQQNVMGQRLVLAQQQQGIMGLQLQQQGLMNQTSQQKAEQLGSSNQQQVGLLSQSQALLTQQNSISQHSTLMGQAQPSQPGAVGHQPALPKQTQHFQQHTALGQMPTVVHLSQVLPQTTQSIVSQDQGGTDGAISQEATEGQQHRVQLQGLNIGGQINQDTGGQLQVMAHEQVLQNLNPNLVNQEQAQLVLHLQQLQQSQHQPQQPLQLQLQPLQLQLQQQQPQQLQQGRMGEQQPQKHQQDIGQVSQHQNVMSSLQQPLRMQNSGMIHQPLQSQQNSDGHPQIGVNLRTEQPPSTPQHHQEITRVPYLSQQNSAGESQCIPNQPQNIMVQQQRIMGQGQSQLPGMEQQAKGISSQLQTVISQQPQRLPNAMGQQKSGLIGQQVSHVQGIMGPQNTSLMGNIRAQLQGVIAKNPQLRHLTPQQQQQLQALLLQRHQLQLQQNQALRQVGPFQGQVQASSVQPTQAAAQHTSVAQSQMGQAQQQPGTVFEVRPVEATASEQAQQRFGVDPSVNQQGSLTEHPAMSSQQTVAEMVPNTALRPAELLQFSSSQPQVTLSVASSPSAENLSPVQQPQLQSHSQQQPQLLQQPQHVQQQSQLQAQRQQQSQWQHLQPLQQQLQQQQVQQLKQQVQQLQQQAPQQSQQLQQQAPQQQAPYQLQQQAQQQQAQHLQQQQAHQLLQQQASHQQVHQIMQQQQLQEQTPQQAHQFLQQLQQPAPQHGQLQQPAPQHGQLQQPAPQHGQLQQPAPQHGQLQQLHLQPQHPHLQPQHPHLQPQHPPQHPHLQPQQTSQHLQQSPQQNPSHQEISEEPKNLSSPLYVKLLGSMPTPQPPKHCGSPKEQNTHLVEVSLAEPTSVLRVTSPPCAQNLCQIQNAENPVTKTSMGPNPLDKLELSNSGDTEMKVPPKLAAPLQEKSSALYLATEKRITTGALHVISPLVNGEAGKQLTSGEMGPVQAPQENGEQPENFKDHKQDPKESSGQAVKREANGEPLLPGCKSEAGHLLLQKLLRAKNVQLASQHPAEGLHAEVNGHVDSKLSVVEQKLQAMPLNKEDGSCKKPPVSKAKRPQKAGDRVSNSRKKVRKEEGLKSTDTIVKQLKQELSLLPLMEPVITANFNLFAPFGSSPINGKSLLKGTFGNAVLDSIPDYYTQLLSKNNLSNPPTPPSSLPPTPPPSVQQKMVNGVTSEELNEAQKDATEAKDREGQKDSSGDEEKSLDLLAALPTPPHNQTEDVRMESDDESDGPDSIVPASSPESILGEETPRFPLLTEVAEEREDRAVSPVIPIIPHARIPVIADTKPYEKLSTLPEHAGKVVVTAATATQGVSWDKGTGSEVSVMLTVSTAAAKNLTGVMAAVAELLNIKIPDSYEVLFPESPVRSTVEVKKCPVDPVGDSGVGMKEASLPVGRLPENSRDWLKQFDAVLPGYTLKNDVDILSLLAQENPVLEKVQHHYVDHVSNLDVRQLPIMPEESSPPLSPFAPSPSSPGEPRNTESELVLEEVSVPPALPSLPPSSPPKEELKEPLKIKQRSRPSEDGDDSKPRLKKWKGLRWKRLRILITIQKGGSKRNCEKEISEFIDNLGSALRPETLPQDLRKCCFCHEEGDGATDGPARLLNLDLDLWVHLNCALWSTEVYETQGGALINVEVALHRGLLTKCTLCQKTGATNSCNRIRCPNVYHFACAIRTKCMFFKDKTMLCPLHKLKGPCEQELSSFTVFRRVYIERDEVNQIASIIQRGERIHMFRVGGLIFHAIGQLLPHQMPDFHSATALYPVGYEATRIYWSMRYSNRRCCYRCSICESSSRPEFMVQVMEQGLEDVVLTDSSPQAVWNRIVEPVAKMRRETDMLRLFPEYLKGEELFGLTVHAVLRIAESLPGVESCQNYLFRYGRHPLMELPLMINPTGCARSEPKILTHYKRPHTLNSTSMSKAYQSTFTGETNTPYSKQFVHSKSSQYRRLKTEWKNNVYLARSRIQGLGLYASKDIEKHTMVIEYIGTIIRNEVANRREKIYEEQNRGIYMFRINNEHVIDATLTGGPARYINHSCAPNCVAEVVTFDKEDKIIIISSRRIPKGEELTYDYQFDFEDDQHKIPCHCGAWNCRKWMN
ncbi:histone-lysine N-methyltransferase 2D isoform X3 [Rhinatrema bivittatum]|uniref:histone-lysine N-methyltransferase 2D isoform X3 n=1 Tax=Rhinatrema bivittatum TaxID=194408 RepID=UPI00112AF51D|nr:histone-lysine N-methyltransferase 2D isoform X3 [Rhinatrema bivittatum]